MSTHYEGAIMVDTLDGLVVLDTSIRPRQGDTIYFEAWDMRQLGKFYPTAIICKDGDTIEGESLEEVVEIGVVTWVVTARGWRRADDLKAWFSWGIL